jgi:hypothetical protein
VRVFRNILMGGEANHLGFASLSGANSWWFANWVGLLPLSGSDPEQFGPRAGRPPRAATASGGAAAHSFPSLPWSRTPTSAARTSGRAADPYNRFSPQYAASGLALKFPISTYPSDAYSAIACGWRGPVSRRTTR